MDLQKAQTQLRAPRIGTHSKYPEFRLGPGSGVLRGFQKIAMSSFHAGTPKNRIPPPGNRPQTWQNKLGCYPEAKFSCGKANSSSKAPAANRSAVPCLSFFSFFPELQLQQGNKTATHGGWVPLYKYIACCNFPPPFPPPQNNNTKCPPPPKKKMQLVFGGDGRGSWAAAPAQSRSVPPSAGRSWPRKGRPTDSEECPKTWTQL